MNLSGKTAVVTGGSRGIGQGIVLKLAEAGAHVITNYNSTPPDTTKKLVEEKGGSLSAYQCNLTSTDSINEFVKAINNEVGQVDVLVNNAGITKDNLLVRMSEEEWDDVINVNLKAVFLLTKLIAKGMMKKRTGSIINITSVVGLTGNPGQSNYAATKAGIQGFTRSVAKELASRNVRANCVAPGYIITDMTGGLTEEAREKLTTLIPMQKLGSVQNIADTVIFLASDLSEYITGETINVNGGMYMN
ncbi:MAG: 3-oxoacyl-[acyl-carrier-protein] reductase [Nitrospinae bacterium]|nr:3-oxoacyl-[acyl-carrier-protein] reductase [Nitrospinota bacterium]